MRIAIAQMKPKQIIQLDDSLERAKQEAQQENWSEVVYYLRNSPIFATKSSFPQTDTQEQELAIELALATLIKGEFQQKWDIAKVFPSMGVKITAPLIDLLQSAAIDTETKWFAARSLGNFSEQTVVIALAQLIQNTQDSDLIAIAAKSLVNIGNPAIEVLIDLVKNPKSRLIAAKSLAHIRLAATLPTLLELVKDENPEIRLLAIEALGSFHQPEIPPVLIEALKDTNSKVRKEAVIALGFCPDLCSTHNLVNCLQPLLYDLNPDVSRQTAVSLARMKDYKAVEALNEALRSQSSTARTAVAGVARSQYNSLDLKLNLIKALAWSNLNSALDCLQDAIKTSDKSIRREIITALGRIRQPELKLQAFTILQEFWHSLSSDELDFESKKALATALGELKVIEGKNILQELKSDREKIVKLYAVSSLKKLAPKN